MDVGERSVVRYVLSVFAVRVRGGSVHRFSLCGSAVLCIGLVMHALAGGSPSDVERGVQSLQSENVDGSLSAHHASIMMTSSTDVHLQPGVLAQRYGTGSITPRPGSRRGSLEANPICVSGSVG